MGKIFLFDDEKNTLDTFEFLFKDLGLKNEPIKCINLEEFRKSIAAADTNDIRGFIIDLAKDKGEDGKGTFSVADDIEQNFNKYRVPIFIHSGNLNNYDRFDDYGTVFKIEKGKNSSKEICELLKKFEETGFIELFPQNGVIESSLMSELHDSFTRQFKDKDIKNIIDSIDGSSDEKIQRVKDVFLRIAVRSLISKLLKPIPESEYDFKIHGVEHFLRRQNGKEFWTGDIHINKESKKTFLILTPRCDVSKKDPLAVVVVREHLEVTHKTVDKFITDNIKNKNLRYIPKTAIYDGGVADFASFELISRKELTDSYDYFITLSDELTNDIISKYCSYVSRSGIEEMNIEETKKFFSK
jgi:hypothetical protein